MEKENKKNFEDSINELEEIVTQLEKGDLNLDQSVEKFEEGIEISKKCNKFLEEAEKRITLLIQEDDGEIKEQNFVQES